MMKIGISVCSNYVGTSPGDAAGYMVERTVAAKQAGLDKLFVGDHHVTAVPYMQNNVMLARMLAEWGDRPYGALYLLPLWHPVLLAEQVGTLAALSPGRFIMQCGLGDEPQGSKMGIDLSKRVGMFMASLRTLQALWSGKTTSEARYWNIKDAVICPVPEEPVEVWVGAGADRAIKRAASVGDAWLGSPALTLDAAGDALKRYQAYCDQAGSPPKACAIRRDMFIGASSEEAEKVIAPYVDKGYRGIDPSALLTGSIEQAAEHILVLKDQGYTDVIVRNISRNQNESLASIERLAEVRNLI